MTTEKGRPTRQKRSPCTEALLIIGPEILSNPPDHTAQVLFTGAAWVINLAVAEYVIHCRARAAAADVPGVYAVKALN